MCRNIKQLYNFEPPATNNEIRDAASQFVRKVSGLSNPKLENEIAFDIAVDKISIEIKRLIDSLQTTAKPKNREEEKEKAKVRNEKRFGGE